MRKIPRVRRSPIIPSCDHNYIKFKILTKTRLAIKKITIHIFLLIFIHLRLN